MNKEYDFNFIDEDKLIDGRRLRKNIGNQFLKSAMPDMSPMGKLKNAAYLGLWRPETRAITPALLMAYQAYESYNQPSLLRYIADGIYDNRQTEMD